MYAQDILCFVFIAEKLLSCVCGNTQHERTVRLYYPVEQTGYTLGISKLAPPTQAMLTLPHTTADNLNDEFHFRYIIDRIRKAKQLG